MPRSINGRVATLCGLLVLAAVVGSCQRGQTEKLALVEGTVSKGGCPLSHMEVVFLADAGSGTQGPRASGITDQAGHYRLRSHNGDDGVVAGKHRVLVNDLEAAKKQTGLALRGSPQKAPARLSPEQARRSQEQRKTPVEASRVPPGYGRFNETPLRVEVHPGPQTLNFDIP